MTVVYSTSGHRHEQIDGHHYAYGRADDEPAVGGRPKLDPLAPHTHPVLFEAGTDTMMLQVAVVTLEGGRTRLSDRAERRDP